MANVPIHSLETDIVIAEEVETTQSISNSGNNSTITIDNRKNLQREPIITITLLDNTLTSITITNTTTNQNVVITNLDPGYPSGTILTVYNDAVYDSEGNEVPAVFSSLFNISENAQNTLRFNIVPITGSHIDASVKLIKASDTERTEAFVQGFNISETITLTPRQINKLNHYSNGHIANDINFTFSIERLFWDNYYLNLDPKKSYCIFWRTDTSVTDINQYDFALCGCKFSTIGISQRENDMVKEALQGSACKLF